jgi:hypothetical protein
VARFARIDTPYFTPSISSCTALRNGAETSAVKETAVKITASQWKSFYRLWVWGVPRLGHFGRARCARPWKEAPAHSSPPTPTELQKQKKTAKNK